MIAVSSRRLSYQSSDHEIMGPDHFHSMLNIGQITTLFVPHTPVSCLNSRSTMPIAV
jgi:hypothetical protein